MGRPASAAPVLATRAEERRPRPSSAQSWGEHFAVSHDLLSDSFAAVGVVKGAHVDGDGGAPYGQPAGAPYEQRCATPDGDRLPQFRPLSSGYITAGERDLAEQSAALGVRPRQPDRVRAWTSAVPAPPPTAAQVFKRRGRASEQLCDPLSLEGTDCRGVAFAGRCAQPRPRRSDRMAQVLAAKKARELALGRRLGQGEGHKEREGTTDRWFRGEDSRSQHQPPGQPLHGLPREHIIRKREMDLWARENPNEVKERARRDALDKVLFEKNRLRKMITDKLTQENNDKKQLVAAKAQK